VLERASADLQVTSKASPILVNAEQVHAFLVMTLPGFDVDLNARSFESAFIFYNTWVATAAAGSATTAANVALSPIVASPSPTAGAVGSRVVRLRKMKREGEKMKRVGEMQRGEGRRK